MGKVKAADAFALPLDTPPMEAKLVAELPKEEKAAPMPAMDF